jgi:hypothetical protein
MQTAKTASAAGTYTADFFAGQADGSLASARVVLPVVFDLLGRPASMADIGCGRGTWLKAALELGVPTVTGVDGPWAAAAGLLVPSACFVAGDVVDELGRLVAAGRRAELAACLEVAEHLPASRARDLVSGLAGLSDAILFSAAIPHQGGTWHVNEAWPDYWSRLFDEREFQCFDVLRAAFWNHESVEWWYAQNILIFARGAPAERLRGLGHTPAPPLALVHPKKFEALWNQYQGIRSSPAWRATAPARALVNVLRRWRSASSAADR